MTRQTEIAVIITAIGFLLAFMCAASDLPPTAAAAPDAPSAPAPAIAPEGASLPPSHKKPQVADYGREPAWANESDPFRRCAKKALSGEFGELADWQRCAYEWGLVRGVTVQGRAKVTSYGHKWENEDGQNEWTASGSHVHRAGCAANPELPFGAVVWTPYGLRYVFDRGGWVKLNRTNAREVANLDYYTWSPMPTLRDAPFAVVKEHGDRSMWHRQSEL